MGKKNRIKDDSFLWVFCCCVGLPIIGFIKGLIIVIPISIISIFGFTGIALILLPHDIVLTYRALIRTSIIGINLKILSMLLLPFALVGCPILVFFLSCCFGFLYSFIGATIKTFDSSYDLFFGGIIENFEDVWKFIRVFWDFNYYNYFCYLIEIEEKEVEEPFDIHIIKIIIGLLLACYGSIVGIIVFTPMWLIKLIPSITKIYYYYINFIKNLSLFNLIMYSIYLILGFCLIPALGVLTILLYIGYALFGGIRCAIEGYLYNTLCGLICIWECIYDIDEFSNLIIFDKKYSCFPNVSEIHKIKKYKKSTNNKEEVSIKVENSETLEKNNNIETGNKQDNSIEDKNDVPQELII